MIVESLLIASVGIIIISSALLLGYLWFVVRANPPLSTRILKIGTASITVECADTMLRRARGLSYQKSLEPGNGMLFVFSKPGVYGFWMQGMQFPIDIVWIRDNIVVATTEHIPVEDTLSRKHYYPPLPVSQVLELPAGEIQRTGIVTGASIALQ